MVRRKTIIEEDDDTSTSRSTNQTIINEDNGLMWVFGVLLLLVLWGVIGAQIVESSNADCSFGTEKYFCWFWSSGNDVDININFNSDGESAQNTQSDSGNGLGY